MPDYDWRDWERVQRARRPLSHRLHLADDVSLTIFGVLLAVLTLCLAIAAVIAAIAIPLSIADCHQGAERQGTTGSYQFPSGCYYRLKNGSELPADQFPAKRIKIQRSHKG